MLKRVIQAYKAPGHWTRSPPGIGDYIRGLCHLHELGQRQGFDVRADVSTTDYWDCVDRNSSIFCESDPVEVNRAQELGDLHDALLDQIQSFMRGAANSLFVTTNLGDWQRATLPEITKTFARRFYAFRPDISARSSLNLDPKGYAVLSVRVGDPYFGKRRLPSKRHLALIFDRIETGVLPLFESRIVVMSDSEAVKESVARRFGFTPTATSFHGSSGGAAAVCRDLDLLANSASNFHINAWKWWWSGFSHYTSVIFDIPSINYAPVAPPSLHYRLLNFGRRLRRRI